MFLDVELDAAPQLVGQLSETQTRLLLDELQQRPENGSADLLERNDLLRRRLREVTLDRQHQLEELERRKLKEVKRAAQKPPQASENMTPWRHH